MNKKEIDLIETEMETTIRDAMKDGRVPSECVQTVEIGDYEAKVVVFHEC